MRSSTPFGSYVFESSWLTRSPAQRKGTLVGSRKGNRRGRLRPSGPADYDYERHRERIVAGVRRVLWRCSLDSGPPRPRMLPAGADEDAADSMGPDARRGEDRVPGGRRGPD